MLLLLPLLNVFDAVLDLLRYFLFAYIILGWLEAFDIINRYNKFVYGIHNFLFRILEPLLNQIRRFMPDLGGIDLSPLVLVLAIIFLRGVIVQIAVRFAG
ncbi:MAG: YggT family protein [Pseudomonadota bacterium]